MTFPVEYEKFKSLAESALARWAPGATAIYRAMKSGRSGAAVLKVDIRGKHTGEIENGVYILKLSKRSQWANQQDESKAHEFAYKHNIEFSRKHIPSLVDSFSTESEHAILYDIAGASLDRYMAVDTPENSGFLAVCELLISETLRKWVSLEPDEDKRPDELLEGWLGYRVDRTGARELHDLVEREIGSELRFTESGEVLINPLAFYNYSKAKQWAERGCLKALLHGDLHGGNILVSKFNPRDEPYWIIDFALSKEGAAGFDQAYLELSQIIYCLGERNAAQLISVLKHLDGDTKALLPEGTYWLRDCLQMIRSSVFAWRDDALAKRKDDFDRQFCLARIAAGLNWANKPLPDNQRYLALCYAGWAARNYLMTFEPEDWAQLWKVESQPKLDDSSGNSADSALWEELWNLTKGFSPRAGRYVLVAEAQEDATHLRAVGQLPWSAVIDLDPYSDQSGLYRHAAPTLQAHRSLHTFSISIPVVQIDRATSWMMAAGWVMKNEPPTDYENWLWDRMHLIRMFIKGIEDAVNPTPLFVIVVPGKTLDAAMPSARIEKVLGAINEGTRGRATILYLGPSAISEPIRIENIPIDPSVFFARLDNAFGSTSPTSDAQIPAGNKEATEWRSIPVDILRTLQENLEILHSNILTDISTEDGPAVANQFWRGKPPSWADFHQGNDIERIVNDKLVRILREELEASRNRTILLNHNPGAGGTTAAFRAAWDLHWEYPTAVLRHWSPALSDRLQQLFILAQRPILLVADSGDLNEAASEDLYRGLSQQNTRVVILYIRRVLGSGAEYPMVLFDPMERKEARSFKIAFAAKTDDARRHQELIRITEEDEFERYRSAFFYGLITFEHEFLGVDRYVASHLHGLRGKARDLVEYIALLTIFSNTGLHEIILRRLMRLSGDLEISLSDIVGEGPARLMTVRQERVRLMHQIIAEEVLNDLAGGGTDSWRRDLLKISVDFIHEVTACSSPSSQTVLSMFRLLFTERPGGGIDGVEDRGDFAQLIEAADFGDPSHGHQILKKLTEDSPLEPHFWNHLGRHQIYRMRRDPKQAEKYLQEAIRLSPDDYIHYHTLGLARRSSLREILSGLKNQPADEILSAVSQSFDDVVEAFEKTRKLNPENIYGYITHVQTIFEVADQLKRASGVENIGQLPNDGQSVILWVEEQVAYAERLLTDAKQLYGTLDQGRQSSYITQCYATLERLYGDLDRVIQIWELANEHGDSNSAGRRALANAYFARNGRRWDTMPLSELSRIVELTEQNLRSPARRDDDYRLWFEAYKFLPEFDIDEAIANLYSWSSHFPSWRAHYYLYILYFHMWFSGRIDSISEMVEALEKCQRYIIGRSHISHQWLGFSPTDCPLVSADSMGEWQNAIGFWQNKDRLRPINGFIDDIQRPQAGHILIDGKVRAFFVPSRGDFDPNNDEYPRGFYRNKDENAQVHFYLGFSPVGLRAWEVKRGHVEGGNRIRFGSPQTFRMPQEVYRPAISEEVKLRRVTALKLSRVLDFINDVVKAREATGGELALNELERRLEAVFRVDGIIKELGYISLEELLKKKTDHTLREVGKDLFVGTPSTERSTPPEQASLPHTVLSQIVMLSPNKSYGFIADAESNRFFHRDFVLAGQRDKLKGKGQIVEFVPDTDEKGQRIAIKIKVFDDTFSLSQKDELVPKTLLREALKNAISRILQNALIDGDEISVTSLHNQLSHEFRGPAPLASRVGVKRLEDFLKDVDTIHIFGQHPNQFVRLKDERTFGRLPYDRAASKEDVADKVKDFVLTVLSKHGRVRVDALYQRLKRSFGASDNMVRQLGYSTFPALLSDIPEVQVWGPNPKDQFVRLASMPETLTPATEDEGAFSIEPKTRAIALVRKAEGQQISVTRLSFQLSKLIRGAGRLADRLGYATFPDFLRTIPELWVSGTRPNQIVRLRGDRKLSSKSLSGPRAPKTEEFSLADVKQLVVDILRNHKKGSEGVKLTSLGSKLSPKVRGSGTLAARLGFKSFADFINEIPQCELFGDPNDACVRLVSSRLPTPSHEPDGGLARTSNELAKDILVSMVQEAGEKTLHLTQVAHRLHEKIPGHGKLIHRLGVQSLRHFVAGIPEVELYEIDRPDPLIRLKSPAKQSFPTEKKSIDAIKKFVLDLVREAQSSKQELTLPRVTALLDAEVDGSGSLAARLGYESFRKFLEDLPQLEVYEKRGNQFVRLSPPKRGKRSPDFTTRKGTETPKANSRVNPKDLVLEIVRQNELAGRKLTPLSLASVMARRMSGKGKLAERLGHKTFTEFLETIPEIKFERILQKQYVVTKPLS